VVMMELKLRQNPLTLADALGAPVDPRLEAFIARGLAREPDTRFQTAHEALAVWRTLRPSGATSVVTSTSLGRNTVAPTEPNPSDSEPQTAPIVRHRSVPDSTLTMPTPVGSLQMQPPDEDRSTLQRPPTASPSRPQSTPFAPSAAPGPLEPAASRPALTPASIPRQRHSLGTLVAVAIALILLGFGVVAVAISLLGR